MKKNFELIEACELIQTDKLSPQNLLNDCLAQAEMKEAILKAFLARASMAEMLKDSKAGPLKGIPVAVKDIIATKDLATTNGSPIYKDTFPKQDAPIIQKIRQLGGVIFGKTVTTEFAWRAPGPTTNPWNAEHTPGGSSSGSAAAVAAGIVPLALGSQTQGSIIRPAAFCGIVGLKASFGAVPRLGAHPLSGSCDHIGFFTRSVDDAAYALQLLKNTDLSEEDSIVLPDLHISPSSRIKPFNQPRIAVIQTPFDYLMSAEQGNALQVAADHLRSAGATVETLNLPQYFWDGINAMNLIIESEAANIHQDHIKNHKDLLSIHIQELSQRGLAHSAVAYLNAKNTQKKLRSLIPEYFKKYDAFLSIPAAGEAPKGLSSTGDPIFCALWSFLGIPSITIPFKKSSNGLPLGIQFVANYKEDEKLLQVAKFAETVISNKADY
jgi:Asp-tRNA(Asn)/Glu-tRNA(Gln) amidotransferase A subunit family amidase